MRMEKCLIWFNENDVWKMSSTMGDGKVNENQIRCIQIHIDIDFHFRLDIHDSVVSQLVCPYELRHHAGHVRA